MWFKSVFLKLLKGELRTAISVGVLFLVFITIGLAADQGVTYKFDFGDGQGLAPGYIAVDGNISIYPKTDGTIQFGWLGVVIEKSSGAMVSDLRLRDSNTGVDPAIFKIGNLEPGSYSVDLISGDLNDTFLTKLSVGEQSYTISTVANNWRTFTFGAVVGENGELKLSFERVGKNLWGVNALILTKIPEPLPAANFNMQITPSEHVVKKGGTVVYKVSLDSLNGYASNVNLSLEGLVEGISAQFLPASGIPPFISDLRITTNNSTPATHYDFIINSQGEDADTITVNQNISLVVTDLQYVPITSDSELSDSIKGQIEDIYSQPSTLDDDKEAQKLIQEFIDQIQNKKLADHVELKGIEDIKNINFTVYEELSQAKTTFESSLLYLTQAGIIGSVVDSAPPAEDTTSEPPSQGLFERLLSTFTNPAR